MSTPSPSSSPSTPPGSLPALTPSPARTSAEMIAELREYVIADPYPFCVDLERCEGMWLGTVEGGRVFDWAGYYGSKWIAHNHPRMFEPAYLQKLSYAANNKLANPDFLTHECLDYYRALHALAPRCMRGRTEVYAVNSGAEAVENMMKYLINLHDRRRGKLPGPRRFIYFDQAFHGRTIYALNVTELTHSPIITRDYHGLVHGNIQIPFPAIDCDAPPEAAAAITREALIRVDQTLRDHPGEIVGLIVEPLQGAGGHRVAEPEFFQGLSRLAHEHGVFLGLDEVQTAGGQTGEFFMADQLDLPHPPQAIASGKKLGNGILYMLHPMDDEGVLDSTWGGSLADMVRFCQELAIVRDEKLLEQVPAKTAHLVARLRDLQRRFPAHLRNIRGAGLYQGFDLATSALKSALADTALKEESLLLLPAGRTSIRLRPHLHVTNGDIDLLVEKLARLLAKLSA